MIPASEYLHNEFALFFDGDELYDSMLASIAAARECIQLETYIFADDEVGRRFTRALIERAQQGVTVRLHIDAAGSLFLGAHRLIRILQKENVDVRWFHRWSWRRPLRYNRRNHRKLLVVDRHEAFLGGFNIHRENSRRVVGDQCWRDTHVRVRGPLCDEAAQLFDEFWDRRQRWKFNRHGGMARLMSNHTRRWRRMMRALYIQSFYQARHSIHITTPYFVPDHVMQQALIDAAQRGVDVRLLLPSKTDIWLVRWASHAVYDRLLEAGVGIYEYQPRILHAKSVVIDGGWAVIGTANLDYRSLFVNYELILIMAEAAVCTELERRFSLDLQQSARIVDQRWVERPIFHHIAEMIGWLVRRWL